MTEKNYITTELEDVLLLRWLAVTRPDVEDVVEWIRDVTERQNRKVAYAAVVPVDSKPPEPDGRRALMEGHQSIADMCTTMRVVILGRGMRQAIIRSISAGIMLASGLRGKGFEIDDCFEAALDGVGRVARPSRQAILDHALAKGIIRPDELAEDQTSSRHSR